MEIVNYRIVNYYENLQKLANTLNVDLHQLAEELLISPETLEKWKTPGVGPSTLLVCNMIGYLSGMYMVLVNEHLEIVKFYY